MKKYIFKREVFAFRAGQKIANLLRKPAKKPHLFERMVIKMKTNFQVWKKIIERLKEASEFSKIAVKLGALMMLCFYITGTIAYIIAPEVPNYFGAMSVFRGSMEAAPASLASGICAAVICELVHRSKSNR